MHPHCATWTPRWYNEFTSSRIHDPREPQTLHIQVTFSNELERIDDLKTHHVWSFSCHIESHSVWQVQFSVRVVDITGRVFEISGYYRNWSDFYMQTVCCTLCLCTRFTSVYIITAYLSIRFNWICVCIQFVFMHLSDYRWLPSCCLIASTVVDVDIHF